MEPRIPRRRDPRDLISGVRRAVLRRRRLLAAVLAVLAVGAGLRAVAPPAPETVPLVVAAADLSAGATVDAADLTTIRVAPDVVPRAAVGSADAAVGAVLAGPLGAGEPVTRHRVLGADLTAADPGVTAVPVRLGDADQAALLRAGQGIDLFSTDPETSNTELLAAGVTVLGVPRADGSNGGGPAPGRVVVLGVPHDRVGAVTTATVTSYVTFAWAPV